MAVVRVELPDALVAEAEAGGLLSADALTRLLFRALRERDAATAMLAMPARVAEAGGQPIPMAEIDAEVKAVRGARRLTGGRSRSFAADEIRMQAAAC